MGIKHFFYWYKTNFSETMTPFRKSENLHDMNKPVDTLLIDLNGSIHDATQKTFLYGNYKQPVRLLGGGVKIKNNDSTLKKVFSHVCESIDWNVRLARPRKKLFIAIDGVAPASKMNQQRQRRFRAARDNENVDNFDSNCITPGTEFMHKLSLYIDDYIIKMMENDPNWGKIEVIFSNEKVPGEGEHKAMEYIREHGSDEDTYCLVGNDADLIMLALATNRPKFYLIREDSFNPKNDFFLMDMNKTRHKLIEMIRWNSSDHTFNERQVIYDFIFVCFMVGNDFLPHIPSLEIIENGIEQMLESMKNTGITHGHLTSISKSGKVIINKESLYVFLTQIGNCEKANFETKLSGKKSFFPDKLLTKYSKNNSDGQWILNINGYVKEYNSKHFGSQIENVCNEYLNGLQWVLSYYTTGCPSWKWCFNYHYAPPASTLSSYILGFKGVKHGVTKPSLPYEQLLSVLPPKSYKLLPESLGILLKSSLSELAKFCPEDFVIDLEGKRKEWEGIVILPIIDYKVVKKLFKQNKHKLNENENNINSRGDLIFYV